MQTRLRLHIIQMMKGYTYANNEIQVSLSMSCAMYGLKDFEDYFINSIEFKYLSTINRITNCLSNDDTGHAQNLNYIAFDISDYKTLLSMC